MKQEYVDIVDEDDNVIEVITRKEMEEERPIPLHRGVFIFVFNSKGELFVHQRSKNKSLFPGLYGTGAGGLVQSGEWYDEAAARELREELGIKGIELGFMFDFRYKGGKDNYKGKVYKCVYDGKLRILKSEMEHGEFKTIDEIKQMAKKGMLCPDTKLFFEKYLENERHTKNKK